MSSSTYQLLPLSSSAADKPGPTLNSGRARVLVSIMNRTKRRFALVLIIFAIGFLLLNIIISLSESQYTGKTAAYDFELPEGTWTCTDDHLSQESKDTKYNRRSRQCIVENLCVDRKGM